MMQEPKSLDEDYAPWQQRYEQGATGWDRGESSPALRQWLEDGRFKTVKSVVVPGCGRGHEVVELALAGFEVTALDFAPAAISALSSQLVDRGTAATLIQDSVLNYKPRNPFDAIYEQTCLCALAPEHWTAYESQLAKWVKPGGTLFALFMQTEKPDGPPFHCDIQKMKTIFGASRWEWPSQTRRIDHPSGMYEIAVTIQRTSQEGIQ